MSKSQSNNKLAKAQELNKIVPVQRSQKELNKIKYQIREVNSLIDNLEGYISLIKLNAYSLKNKQYAIQRRLYSINKAKEKLKQLPRQGSTEKQLKTATVQLKKLIDKEIQLIQEAIQLNNTSHQTNSNLQIIQKDITILQKQLPWFIKFRKKTEAQKKTLQLLSKLKKTKRQLKNQLKSQKLKEMTKTLTGTPEIQSKQKSGFVSNIGRKIKRIKSRIFKPN